MALHPRPRTLLAVAASAALMAAGPASAGTKPSPPPPQKQQQTCPLILGLDPDTVTLTGPKTLWPPTGRLVTYTLTAAESAGEGGDGLPHGVTISYSVTYTDSAHGAKPAGAAVVPASGNASGDLSVPIRFALRAARAGTGGGRTYTITWSASFDGGPHTCSSSSSGNSPFVVTVAHDHGH